MAMASAIRSSSRELRRRATVATTDSIGSRRLTNGRQSLPLRETVREDLFFRGDHGLLMSFLTECSRKGCEPLSETRFQELAQAVENLSRRDYRGVNLKQDYFKEGNSDPALKEVLGHLCIPTREEDIPPSSADSDDIGTDDDEVLDASVSRPLTSTNHRVTWKAMSNATTENTLRQDDDSDGNEAAADAGANSSSLAAKLQKDCRASRATSMATSFATDVMEEELMSLHQAFRRPELESDVFMVTYAFKSPVDLLSKHRIRVEKFAGWMLAIAAQYFSMPYHNWQHAMDVFFFSVFSVVQGQGERFFTFQDILALYVAAIAHDVGHLGVNNNFLINTRSRLATTYNDQSVLENMHASKCFESMKKSGFDFLDTLSFEEFNSVRASVIAAILATDMAQHFEFVDHLSARVSKKEQFPFARDLTSQEKRESLAGSKADRKLLLQAFLHLADLGTNCRAWPFCWKVVVGLEEEVFAQGDRERDLGLPICPLGDRTKDSMGCAQDFFLMKIVRPLLEPCTEFLSEEVSEMLVENLTDNKQRWTDLLAKHGKRTAGELCGLMNSVGERQEAEILM